MEIEYRDIELTITSYCAKFPVLSEKFDYNKYIHDTSFNLICDVIKNNVDKFTSYVPRQFFSSVRSPIPILDYELNLVYNKMTELPEDYSSNVLVEFKMMLDVLVNRQKKQEIILDLEKIITDIKNDNTREAFQRLHDIELIDTRKSIPNIKLTIVNSIDETNAFKTGIDTIDNKMGGFHKGNLYSIIGESGSMKTMSSMFVIESILRANKNFTCLYFEKEMPAKDLGRRLLSRLTNIDGSILTKASVSQATAEKNKIKADATVMLMDKDNELADIINRIRIVPNDTFADAYDIYSMVEKYKPDIWCLDYFTLIGDTKNVKDSHQFYSQQAKVLKNIVGNMDCFGIILQQTKQNSLSDRPIKIPEISDAEYGAVLKQLCAYVSVTFYPKSYDMHKRHDNPWPKEHFYLVGRKNRQEENFNIPVTAYPKTSLLFETTKEPACSEQMNRLYTYISNDKKKG